MDRLLSARSRGGGVRELLRVWGASSGMSAEAGLAAAATVYRWAGSGQLLVRQGEALVMSGGPRGPSPTGPRLCIGAA
jgi:hypothetical protein